ncbi:MAG: hypothetical protein AABY76_01185, partial [Planctomycetota bacterium]
HSVRIKCLENPREVLLVRVQVAYLNQQATAWEKQGEALALPRERAPGCKRTCIRADPLQNAGHEANRKVRPT